MGNDRGIFNTLLIDTTLRDGEQAPGVVFDLNDKIRIACLLEQAGIKEVELGTPVMGSREVNDIKTIVELGLNFRSTAWCRANRLDLDAALKTGVNSVNISFPVSPILLKALGKNYHWVIENLRDLVRYASDHFEYIAIGAQDASRAEFSFLSYFLAEANRVGASRLRIADTVGLLTPLSTMELFTKVRKILPDVSLEFHGHNDLGMATANTLTALQTGADAASLTVNGLGERAGNAALEELVMALDLGGKMEHGIHTEVLNELCMEVSKASGIPIHDHKAITGSKVLSHESGIHTSCLLANRETYQIIDPEKIGRPQGEFVFGKHSGTAALISFLNSKAIAINKAESVSLLHVIKEMSCRLKRSLSQLEVQNLYLNKEYVINS
ncbi:Homocitrate synthase [Arcticibacter svalbardensis MN12-7]|uniref:Homocitrate synthase n=1 Tax=Arcticibacter svalbardensis MN12-7 TaxID=1150600 RepID=R9GRF6_9SPHI|nr:homocitrate synthase [Arcticibacter svalbardensis]EOR94273.1 Homocitrate synthase [Arcticibacter svalbardensis MN12-7]